ncbi:hypothetical protein A8W25_00275 [Streptomyces sp. ERV7]|nr:hypothetical protein A8W25_00275 [Streptomyces sp. ERV7]
MTQQQPPTPDHSPDQSPDPTDTPVVPIHQDPASMAIRAWAGTQGYLVNDRGRIPASIREEYEQGRRPM